MWWLNRKMTNVTPKEAIHKLIDAKSYLERYSNPHDKWTDAVNIGIEAIEETMTQAEDIDQISDEVCENICRWREQAFSEHKDPDDAENWLCNNHCSADCPIVRLREKRYKRYYEERK